MNGQMMGTSIKDLHNMEKMDKMDNFGSIRNLQEIQQMPQIQNMQQMQMQMQQMPNMQQMSQLQFNDSQHMSNYSQFSQNPNINPNQNQNPNQNPIQIPIQNYNTELNQTDISDIEDLVRNINDNMPEDSLDFTNQTDDKNIQEKEETSSGILNIPKWLREPLLILVIYLILSQTIVKDTIGKYIKQINPGTDGSVSFVGVLIYGIILAVLYVIIKKYLLE